MSSKKLSQVKRNGKARAKTNGSSSSVPQQTRRTLRYATKTAMNPSAGGVNAAHFFSANGLYDPDRSLGGHQPYGFDEYMAMYDHYVVTGSRLMVTFMTYGSTNSRADNYIVATGLRDTTTSTPDMLDFIEMGRGAWSVLGAQNGGNSSATLTLNCDVGKYLGRRDMLSDPDVKGSVSADPQEELFFEITACNLDGEDPGAIDLLVVIEYDAVFIEPKRLVGS